MNGIGDALEEDWKRDAADVAMTTTFGPNKLERFKVWTDEVSESPAPVN